VLGVFAATQVAEAAHAHGRGGSAPIVRAAHGTFTTARAGTRYRFRWLMSIRGDAQHTVSALVTVRYLPQPGTPRAAAPRVRAANLILTRNGIVVQRACRTATSAGCHLVSTGQDEGTFSVRAQLVGSSTSETLKPLSITTAWPLHPGIPTTTAAPSTTGVNTSIMPVQ
jgi:hypothetical protein